MIKTTETWDSVRKGDNALRQTKIMQSDLSSHVFRKSEIGCTGTCS